MPRTTYRDYCNKFLQSLSSAQSDYDSIDGECEWLVHELQQTKKKLDKAIKEKARVTKEKTKATNQEAVAVNAVNILERKNEELRVQITQLESDLFLSKRTRPTREDCLHEIKRSTASVEESMQKFDSRVFQSWISLKEQPIVPARAFQDGWWLGWVAGMAYCQEEAAKADREQQKKRQQEDCETTTIFGKIAKAIFGI